MSKLYSYKPNWLLTCSVLMCLVIGTSESVVGQNTSSAADDSVKKEIQANGKKFLELVNNRDAAGLASHWTESGVFVNEAGQSFVGRAAIQAEYEAVFKDAPADMQLRAEVDSIQVVDPNTAIVEGRAAMLPQPAGQTRVMSRYTAVHVKRDGKWMVAHVRDTRVELPPATGSLEDLGWMVGTWEATKDDVSLQVTARWIENENFLERTHLVTKAGEQVTSGRQIIGVDQVTGRITSWSFNGDGSHATASWTPTKNGWIVDSVGQAASGAVSSATTILTKKDENTFVWESGNRTLGNEKLPNAEPVTITRK